MSKNDWRHVACVYDGSNRYIYIDGTLANSGAKSGSQNDDDTDQWIGYLAGVSSYAYEGQIDEVAIFDYALTPRQIKQDIYNGTTPGKTADLNNISNLTPPVAWYRMGD